MTSLKIKKIDESKNLICFEEITTGLKVQILKNDLIKAIQKLYYWQKQICQTNFSAMLYTLLCKADDCNKKKIFVGFPEETIAYLLWYTSKSKDEFFNKWLKDEVENGNED